MREMRTKNRFSMRIQLIYFNTPSSLSLAESSLLSIGVIERS